MYIIFLSFYLNVQRDLVYIWFYNEYDNGFSRISTQAREGKSLRQHNSNDIEAIVCRDDNWTMYENRNVSQKISVNDPIICYFVLLKNRLVITCYIFILKSKNFFLQFLYYNGHVYQLLYKRTNICKMCRSAL